MGDLGDERQSHGMKFHKAESKAVPFGSNPASLSWKLILGSGTREAVWVAGSQHATGTRSPLPLRETNCSCTVGRTGLERHQGFTREGVWGHWAGSAL